MEYYDVTYYEVQEKMGVHTWLPVWVNSRFDDMNAATSRMNRKRVSCPEKHFRIVRVTTRVDVVAQ